MKLSKISDEFHLQNQENNETKAKLEMLYNHLNIKDNH